MKVKLLRIWVIVSVIVLFTMGSVLHAESRNLTNFTSNDYGFKLGYPSDWEMKEKYMNAEAIFLSPQENAKDTFRENVVVTAVKVPADTDLELGKEATVQQLGNLVTNFFLVAEKRVTLAGVNAYAIVYTGTMGNYQLQWQQIFAIKGGFAYALTYTAKKESYNKFFPYFNQIASSFSFN